MNSVTVAAHGRGILLCMAAMFVFASQDGLTKHLSTVVPIPQILLVRYVFFVFLAVWITRRSGFVSALRSKRPGLQILRSLVLVAEIGLFAMTVRILPLADTHAIVAATPLIVTVLSIPMLGESVGIRRWAAVLAGFAGMLVIVRPGYTVFQPASALALLVAAMFALYIVLTRQVSRFDRSETTVLYTALCGAAVMSVIGPLYWTPPDATTWILLLAIGCTGAGGHLLFIRALEAAPASVLQPFNYTVLVWATVIGFVFFDDLPDGATILGALIIVASGLYTFYRERRRAA
ncbi:MAG: DMT family transporter [Gammaproteobacteria bacterium]|nr:DMT family transporter [Gammaproteobacteria bacterium]